jgi:hypothetical protein
MRRGKHNVPFQIFTQVKFNIVLSLTNCPLKFRREIVSVIKILRLGHKICKESNPRSRVTSLAYTGTYTGTYRCP